jgi:hypothetical protein
MIPVEQKFPPRGLADVYGAVKAELDRENVAARLKPGARVALAAGSRGVANLRQIVSATADWFRDRGCEPFVVPAMGSHGGGTAEGQRAVLAKYGVDDTICPVISSVEVAPLGTTADGTEVFIDRAAAESDGTVLINRIKWHTTFEAPVESGLMKMAAIGLGKLYGATEYHRRIVRDGFYEVIREVGNHVLASGRVLGGVAVLEDAAHETAEVKAIAAARIPEEEPVLLARVKSWMARLPFEEIDILVVDEIGKHVSGVGMDSKVINRHPYGTQNPWSWLPRIRRVYARSVKGGNANGLGMADMVSRRLLNAVDWESTRVNGLTANNLPALRTPLVAECDREAMEILSAAVGRRDSSEVTIVRIQNTMELGRFEVSENLLAQATVPLEVLGSPASWVFDEAANVRA